MSRPAKDLTNRIFGRLTVIKDSGKRVQRHIVWLCRCQCGKEVFIHSQSLQRGMTKSCGCLKKEILTSDSFRAKLRLPLGQASRNDLYASYRASARDRNLSFEITKDQFFSLTDSNCFYCNSKPSSVRKNKNDSGDYQYNGIDRIDNTKGYTLDNVVTCCKICNYAKNALSVNEFKSWAINIYNNWASK